MSSLDEEKLVQMVHDFIESESSSSSVTPIYSSSSNCLLSLQHHQHHQPSYYLTLQEILRSESEAEYEVLESVKKHMMRSRRDTGEKSSSTTGRMKKCLVRKLKGDGFNASLCQSSWSTSLGCPAGDYEYIDIMVVEDEPTRLIVDIDFKSQFELARPTATYKQLTDTLPSIFVGKEEKLNKIISPLCSAAKQSLKESGLHVPPWRTSTYMQSKWLSANIESFGRKREEERSGNSNGFVTSNKQLKSEAIGNNIIIPMVKNPKRSDFGGRSAAAAAAAGCSGLSSQFSKMGINCC